MAYGQEQSNTGEGAQSNPFMVAIEQEAMGSHVHFEFINPDHLMDTAVGNRARAKRCQKDWSRHQLANKAGVTAEDIETFERQPWSTPLGVVAAIIRALGVQPGELLGTPSKTHKFKTP